LLHALDAGEAVRNQPDLFLASAREDVASRRVKRAHEIRFAHGSFVPTGSPLFLFNRQPWHVPDARMSARFDTL